MLRVAVITSSDKGYKGEREDESGKRIVDIFSSKEDYEVVSYKILPDEKEMLMEEMKNICDSSSADLIITTGGTGFSSRDITPEATKAVTERECPGIPEAMRYFSMQITKRAMLSRSFAGIRKNTLIVNLPGSKKACEECLGFVIDDLKHGLEILLGSTSECGRK
ncbi:MAG: MogA/MoaB family molybdenum cofactor biosynthesis protein [Oscillospiraceae bacterium]